ncbi:hypothetical protein [Nonomuraea sp. NPDC048916]|uniref:hypothetical protein n=1 Tax=Nonomuraea sp. NPDC048916 TaxID=3154232 RepID=UPI0033C589FA
MLDGLDLVLRWFLNDVRGRFPDSPVLFADESGGALHRGTIRNRLRYLMQLEGLPQEEWFSPHALRLGVRHPQLRAPAWTWWPSSNCSGTGRSARRCGRRPPSSKTPIAGR